MSETMLRGVFTAIVTPFGKDGEIDRGAFRRLVERQLEAGVAGLVPCGTTGEAPTLEPADWEFVVGETVRLARGKALVIAGTGTNSTAHTVAKTRRAKELGADAALVVTPYYNKPNPEGMVLHYRQVAAEGALPVVVYNVPGRTGQNLPADLTLKLAGLPGVVAIKEASGQFPQVLSILEHRPAGFSVLSGEDDLTCAMVLMGGDGVISTNSNVDPAGVRRMVAAALDGDVAAARSEHFRLQELTRALFLESNPIPVKAALAILGLCEDRVRPPLAPAGEGTRAKVRAGLSRAGLVG